MSVDLGSAYGSVGLKYDGVTQGVARTVAALRQLETAGGGISRNFAQIEQAGERAGKGVADGAQVAQRGVQQLAQSAQDVSGAVDKLANAAGVAGAGIAGGLAVATKQAADLQQGI